MQTAQDPTKKKRTLDEILSSLEAQTPPTLPDPRAPKTTRSLDDILKTLGDSSPAAPPPTKAATPEAGSPGIFDRIAGEAGKLEEPDWLTRDISPQVKSGLVSAKDFFVGAYHHPGAAAKSVAKGIIDPAIAAASPTIEEQKYPMPRPAFGSTLGGGAIDPNEFEQRNMAPGVTNEEKAKGLLATGALVIAGPIEGQMAKGLIARWGVEGAQIAMRRFGVRAAFQMGENVGPVIAAHTLAASATGALTGPAFDPEHPIEAAAQFAVMAPVIKGAHALYGEAKGTVAKSIRERIAQAQEPPPPPPPGPPALPPAPPAPARATAIVPEEPPGPDFTVEQPFKPGEPFGTDAMTGEPVDIKGNPIQPDVTPTPRTFEKPVPYKPPVEAVTTPEDFVPAEEVAKPEPPAEPPSNVIPGLKEGAISKDLAEARGAADAEVARLRREVETAISDDGVELDRKDIEKRYERLRVLSSATPAVGIPKEAPPKKKLSSQDQKMLARSKKEVEDAFLQMAEIEKEIPPGQRIGNTRYMQASAVYRHGVLHPFDEFEGKGRAAEVHQELEAKHGIRVDAEGIDGRSPFHAEADTRAATRAAIEADIPKPAPEEPTHMAMFDKSGVLEKHTSSELEAVDNHHRHAFSEANFEKSRTGGAVAHTNDGVSTTVTVSNLPSIAGGSPLTDAEIAKHVRDAGLPTGKITVIRESAIPQEDDKVYDLSDNAAARAGDTVQDKNGKRWIVDAVRENGSARIHPEGGDPRIGRAASPEEMMVMKPLAGTFSDVSQLPVGTKVVTRHSGEAGEVIRQMGASVTVQFPDGNTEQHHPSALKPLPAGETAVPSAEGEPHAVRQNAPGEPEEGAPGPVREADARGAGGPLEERPGVSRVRGKRGVPGAPPQASGTPIGAPAEPAPVSPGSEREGAGDVRGTGAGPGDGEGAVERETGVPGPRQRAERESASPVEAHAPAAVDYKITDADEIGVGGSVGKARGNIAAIRLLKEIEESGRLATADEQKVLVKYVGWGGLAGVVSADPGSNWKALNAELRELLDQKELEAARRSTLNAHYTSPTVIRAMWDIAARLGFGAHAHMLEPSMGVGHFLGLKPDAIRGSWTGVELDSLTGRIAKQLYQASDIRVQGFETAKVATNSVDLAISNVPFGDYPISDKRYPKSMTAAIHNYFFARTLDLLRPGGVMMYVTSRFTMDAQDGAVRRYLMERAHFLGAIRLPSNAFKGNAGTEVVTDIIVLQKYAKGVSEETHTADDRAFLTVEPEVVDGKGVFYNKWYHSHPRMMIGTLSLEGSMYGANEPTWKYGGDLAKALADRADAFDKVELPGPAAQAKPDPLSEGAITAPDEMRDGQMRVVDGKLMQKEGERLVAADVPQGQVEKVKSLAKLRDVYREALALQLNDASDAAVSMALKGLNVHYDEFVKKYGPINKEEKTERQDKKTGKPVITIRTPNLREFKDDPEWPLVAALEEYDPETGKAKKAAALEGRIFHKREPITAEADPARALLIALDETGKVDLARISDLTGLQEEDLKAKLAGLAFENPVTGEMEHKSKYLSGNVRQKLKEARAAGMEQNVAALEAVQPKDLLPSQISAGLGSVWIPTTDLERFLREVFQARTARVSRLGAEATWAVEVDNSVLYNTIATNKYGTRDLNAIQLLELALNQKSAQVTKLDENGSRKVDPAATVAAQAKQQELKDEFNRWIWSDDKRTERLAAYYNEHYNNMVEPKHDGSHLTFPGMATHVKGEPFHLRAHQKNAIQRALQEGNTLLAHVVGSGKTYTMAAIAVESKRLGFARKPMQIVPNHMLSQFTREFQQLYPGAKLLIATKDDFAKEDRRAFVARAAAGDWDAVVMTHRSFESLPMSVEFQEDFIRDQLYSLEDTIREAKQDRNRDLTKLVEKAKLKLQEKLAALRALDKKDDLLSFEETGIDLLLVDEADMYKNLQFVSKMRNISAPSSQRAFDLFMKSVYLEKVNPGRGLIFATGTPIANSMTEVYTMMRYLQLPLMKKLGIDHFDAWAAQFGESVTSIEMNPTATGYRMKERFSKFKNVADLAGLFRQTWDVLSAADLNLPTPPVRGGHPELVVVPSNPAIKQYLEILGARAEAVKGGQVDPSVDNFLKITTDGRHAAMDMRLVDGFALDNFANKATLAAERIHQIWKDTHAMKGAQLVFSDISAPGSDPSRSMHGVKDFNIYEELRRQLIALGIPEREIAFIHEGDTETRKDRLFADVRAGVKRVLLGSTEKMGAGTNVQDRLVALHDMDAPWRPRDIEQRHGRMVRQGNVLWNKGKGPLENVRILRYVQEGSFDSYMWQTLERKAGFIAQAMKAGPETREMEDVDGRALEYSEIKAITSGNPKIMEKAKVDADVAKLEAVARSRTEAAWLAKREVATLPTEIQTRKEGLAGAQKDLATLNANPTAGDKFHIEIDGKQITDRTKAAELLRKKLELVLRAKRESGLGAQEPVGHFQGFGVGVVSGHTVHHLAVFGELQYTSDVTEDTTGLSLLSRLEHLVPTDLSAERMEQRENRIVAMEKRLTDLQGEVSGVFEKQAELNALKERQARLNAELSETNKPAPDPDAEEMDAGGEDGTEGDLPDMPKRPGGGGYNALAFSDPFSLGVYAVYKSLKDLNTWRKARRAASLAARDPIAPSSFPDIEKRWEASRGLRPVPYSVQLRDAWDAIKKASRHFPELDPTKDPVHALVNEQLLEVEHAKEWAIVVAHDKLLQVMGDLSFAEVDLLTRHLALNDIQKDVEAGLYAGAAELPFGYSEATLDRDVKAVQAALRANPRVEDAVNRRSIFARALTTRLVEIEQLPPEVMDEERYYHRQVLEYAQSMEHLTTGLSTPDVRIHKKGFQRRRVGGGDFNTAYQEAEFEWVSQAVRMIHMHDSLMKIKQLADIKPSLVLQAKTENRQAYHRNWIAEQVKQFGYLPANAVSPLQKFAVRIAFSTHKLYNLLERGILTPGEAAPYQKMLDSLTADRAGWRAANAGKSVVTREPFTFDHPQWFSFLSFLVDRGTEGAMSAATIFKAIREREQTQKDALGRAYKTWEDMIPEGYSTFQPEQGSYFYRALTVEERALQAAILASDVKTREAWVRGQEKPYWVVPSGIAATMEEFGRRRVSGGLERAWLKLIGTWKQFVLLSPARAFKYNLNNLSGDADAANLYPGIYTGIDAAAADSWRFLVTRNMTPALKAEMHELVRLRVVGNTLTVAEIPDISELPGFGRLAKASPPQFMKLIARYWKVARTLTNVRENVLRIAAYRYAIKEIQAGRGDKLLGASNPVYMRAEADPKRRAAAFSRDLIGDYGSVSIGGQFLRERLFPFFSWQEINARRYIRLFRNVAAEGGTSGRQSAILGSITGGLLRSLGARLLKTALLANAFLLLVALWNQLMYPDEARAMRGDNRSTHLILGRDSDGNIRTVRVEGAFADFIDWLGLRDYPSDIADLVSGAAGWRDKLLEAAQAPINKIAQMWEPVSKTAAELATGKLLYPDAFHPRQMRDRAAYLAQQAYVGWLYNKVMDIPQRPKTVGDWVTASTIYRTDPGEAAYYQILDKVSDWNEKHGRESVSMGEPTRRQTALYYWKKAAQWGAEAQADRWLQRYYDLGGKPEGARRSSHGGDPTSSIPKSERQAFKASLDAKEEQALEVAEQWWEEDRVALARESMKRVPHPSRQAGE